MENKNYSPFRERSSAMAISSKSKARLAQDIGDFGYIDDQKKKEEFTKNIVKKFNAETNSKNLNSKNSNYLDFQVPDISGNTKDCLNNIKISEKARLVDLGINYKTIENKPKNFNFKNFITQFEENNIDELEIQDLINFDFDNISTVEEKLNLLVDKVSVLVNSTVGNDEEIARKNHLKSFFLFKLDVSFKFFIQKFLFKYFLYFLIGIEIQQKTS